MTPTDFGRVPRIAVRPRDKPPLSHFARLSGSAVWEVIRKDGTVRRGGEQHNLILDQGLDLVADIGIGNAPRFIAVGTGSGEPDPTDTGLDAEVARMHQNNQTTTFVSNGVYDLTRVIEFDFGVAAGNLTEWGAATDTTGALFSRELFRDAVGDPVTVTVAADEKLRVTYTMRVTIGPVVVTPASIVIAGIGTVNGDHCLVREMASYNEDIVCVSRLTQGLWGDSNGWGVPFLWRSDENPVLSAYNSFAYDETSYVGTSTNYYIGGTGIADYVGGSYEREVSCPFNTADANYLIGGIGFCKRRFNNNQVYADHPAWAFVFDVADRFTKDNLHTLTFTGMTVSWGRDE